MKAFESEASIYVDGREVDTDSIEVTQELDRNIQRTMDPDKVKIEKIFTATLSFTTDGSNSLPDVINEEVAVEYKGNRITFDCAHLFSSQTTFSPGEEIQSTKEYEAVDRERVVEIKDREEAYDTRYAL